MIGDNYSALFLANPQAAMMARRQMLAQALAGKGMSDEPIRAHSQGLNRVAQSALAAMLMYRGDQQAEAMQTRQDEERSKMGALLGQALMGGGMPQQQPQAPPPMQPQASAPNPSAIHMAESGGSMAPGIYGDGGRAAGPMQVHQAALTDYNRANGTAITHQQLAADPAIGKQVGDWYYAAMLRQFGGDPAKAAAAYNAGPGRVAQAVGRYGDGWQAGIPNSTQGYVARVAGQPGGQPQQTAASIPTAEQEMAKARQLSMIAAQAMNSPDPQIQRQGQMAMQAAQQAEQRALALQAREEARSERQQARQDALANRQMQTVQMQDPDGRSIGIYELTPQGPGRRIGNAPRQPGEGGGPFSGTGMDQQAMNTLIGLREKIQNGTANSAERDQYSLAYEHIAQGKVSMVPDPSDPTGQRQMLGRIPGAVPQQFPRPDGGSGASTAGDGIQTIPGTAQPTSSAADRSKLKTIETDMVGIIRSLDTFLDTRERAGTSGRAASAVGLPTELNTTFNVAALLAKGESLFNLGVLNGPDLDIIRRTLADPSTFAGAVTSQDTVRKQVQVIKDLLASRLKIAREQFGGALPSADPRPGGGTLRFNPQTGKIE
jgi:hypothetical protein